MRLLPFVGLFRFAALSLSVLTIACGGAAPEPRASPAAGTSATNDTPAGTPPVSPTLGTAEPKAVPPKAECAAFMNVVRRTTTLRAAIHREPATAAKAQDWASEAAVLADEAKALPVSQPDLVVEAANLATRMSDLIRDLKALAVAETSGNLQKKAAAHKRVISTSEQVEVITREPAARCGGETNLLLPVAGQIRTSDIQRVVRATFPAFQACFEAGLKRNKELRGLVRVQFVIGLDGKVVSAKHFEAASIPAEAVAPPSTSTEPPMTDAAVVACVVHAFLPLQFVQPEGGNVMVIYPVSLAPSP